MEELELNEKTRKELKGSFVELGDGWTHYELSGPASGQTVVLVHGNAAPMLSWDNNVDALTNGGYRVLRYDIFGHGFSDRPNLDSYNRALYDRQLTDLVNALEIRKPFILAGTSQGGSIAACHVARHPGDVQKLALLAPLFDAFNGKGMAFLVRSRFGDFLMSRAREKTFADPSRVLATDNFTDELTNKLKAQLQFKGKRRAVLANIRGDNFENPQGCYKAVRDQKLPVLLTWGEKDASIPGSSMDRLQALIPDIEYHRLPGAGHLAHYEFADVVNPLLLAFFGGKQ